MGKTREFYPTIMHTGPEDKNFKALYLGAERSSAAKKIFSHDNLGVTYHHSKFHFETSRSPEDPPLLVQLLRQFILLQLQYSSNLK